MTQIEILAIAAPFLAGLVVIVTVLVASRSDEKAAEAERKARLATHKDAPSAAE